MSVADVLAMEGWLAAQVEALADCGLPETLVHGDLHLGNVAGCACRADALRLE